MDPEDGGICDGVRESQKGAKAWAVRAPLPKVDEDQAIGGEADAKEVRWGLDLHWLSDGLALEQMAVGRVTLPAVPSPSGTAAAVVRGIGNGDTERGASPGAAGLSVPRLASLCASDKLNAVWRSANAPQIRREVSVLRALSPLREYQVPALTDAARLNESAFHLGAAVESQSRSRELAAAMVSPRCFCREIMDLAFAGQWRLPGPPVHVLSTRTLASHHTRTCGT